MNMETLLKMLSKATGLDIRGYTDQSGADFRYGYASVKVFGVSHYGGRTTPKTINARGRKEGDESERQQLDREGEFKTWKALVEWGADILKTGRTIEVGKGAGLPDSRDLWPPFQPCDHHWEMLIEEVLGERPNREKWDLNPDYQRGHVWTDEQGEKFVGHMLEGGQVPLIFVQRYDSQKNAPKGVDYSTLPIEVIDGQQRLQAICRFMRGKIAAELSDGRRLWYKDFHEVEQRMLPNIKVAYVDVDRATKLRFYLRLNRGGTVHTDAEIQHVRDLLAQEES